VVSAPVIGRVSKVSFERALGTICGGLLGYVAYLVGTNVSQASGNPNALGQSTRLRSRSCKYDVQQNFCTLPSHFTR
jgi:hypothetical protein